MYGTEETVTYTVTDLARAVARAANDNGWCTEVYGYASKLSETLGEDILVTRRNAVIPVRVTVSFSAEVEIPTTGDRWAAEADLSDDVPSDGVYDLDSYSVHSAARNLVYAIPGAYSVEVAEVAPIVGRPGFWRAEEYDGE